MVDYSIAGVQVPNFGADISNALAGRRADEAARQEAVVNQLKLQAWMQDRAYQEKQHQAAAANAAYEMKRRNELGGIMQGFGVTPAAVGRPGQSYSGTGVANDPYADTANKLIGANFIPQAEAILKAQNEGLTGKKIGAETTKIGEETKGILSENQKKAVETRAAQFKEYGDAILRAGSVPEVYALIDSHAQALSELGIPPEQAKKNFVDAYQKNGGDANPDAFSQTLMQSAQGAAVTSKHLADIAQTNAQTYQANAAGNRSMGELAIAQAKAPVDIAHIQSQIGQANAAAASSAGNLKLAQDKQAWEQAHPEYTLQDTAQGMVAVNKKDPTDVKPIQINGETAMPFNKSPVTNINTFTPASEEAQKNYMTTVAKQREAYSSAPATLENIEKAKELIPDAKKFMGTGGDAYLTATKFLNNRLGTNINVEGVKSAEELRSRLFMGIMDNLKKMDAQPTGRQQEALQEAIGQLDTDPNALPKVLDILGDSLRSKVDMYNKDVTDAETRGVKFPYKPQIELPGKKIVPENTFPSEAAAVQILKQRGARPGDRVRVNIGGKTGTFVVE